MAKGVEDTAFYAWVPFVGASEVGTHPAAFARDVARFHAENAARGARHPEGLLATTTHDTKRAEDVRARLAVLTEMPEAFASWALAWRRLGAAHEAALDDELAPSPEDQHLFFQTAFGACPLDRRARRTPPSSSGAEESSSSPRARRSSVRAGSRPTRPTKARSGPTSAA